MVEKQDPKPIKEIDAKDLEDFFRQVEELPERPVGDGRCQLIKRQSGTRSVAVCQGSCDHGDCYTRMRVGPGDRIRVWCECM